MSEVSTNAKIAPNSFLDSFPLGQKIKHSTPKQSEQEIGTLPKLQVGTKFEIFHAGYSGGQSPEIYQVIHQTGGNAGLKLLSWIEVPITSIDLHHSSKDIIEAVLKHGLLKRFHAITQQESNEVSPPFSLVIVPLTANIDQEHPDKSKILNEIFEELDALALQEDNWDGYESKKPSELSLDNARRFVEEFYDAIVSERQPWFTPLISSNEDGYITAEWYGEERQLHLVVEEEDVVYIQVWGPNIDTEMHVDTFHNKDYLTLWKWLFDE